MKKRSHLAALLLALLLLLAPLTPKAETPMGPIPEPSRLGERGQKVRDLQLALLGQGYLEEEQISAVFDAFTQAAVKAFQSDHGLTPSGQADSDSLYLLYTHKVTAPGQPILAPWYAGGSDLIPFGAQFQVQDTRTGLTFSVYRMMGTSHLDAEPLTKEDTATMLKAYAGQWSWNRRPILVKYQDKVYAASMNGMPHSYQSNKHSGFPGHFCIHFPYSRGDSSQRIDAEHLQAAYEAMQSRWVEAGTE